MGDVASGHFTEVAKLAERMGVTMAKIIAGRKASTIIPLTICKFWIC
jgi:hypothetical protein